MNSIKENSNRFFSKGLSKSMWAPFVALQTFLSTHDEEHQVWQINQRPWFAVNTNSVNDLLHVPQKLRARRVSLQQSN
jgi:hypothetical protein